jgi:hypothetical protein
MLAGESTCGESKRGRRRVRLAAGLEKSLSAYARAAAVSGVSLLALPATANAEIVYTPTHTPIPLNGHLLLDLNHDGIADFLFRDFSGGSFSALSVDCTGTSQAHPPQGSACNYPTNQIWGRNRFASALPAGFKVRPNKSYFQTPNNALPALMGSLRISRQSTFTGGQWLYTKNGYLGLQFVIKVQVHYGWARLTVTFPPQPAHGILATLTGYAYETVADKPIITGKTKGPDVITLDPATLGRLAAGASQIPVWRGERK